MKNLQFFKNTSQWVERTEKVGLLDGWYSLEGGLMCSVKWAARLSVAHSASFHGGVSLRHHGDEGGHSLRLTANKPNTPGLSGADQLTQHTQYHISTHCITLLLTNKILWIKRDILWKNNACRHCDRLWKWHRQHAKEQGPINESILRDYSHQPFSCFIVHIWNVCLKSYSLYNF